MKIRRSFVLSLHVLLEFLMSDSKWPALIGTSYPVTREIVTSTLVQPSVNGLEIRIPLYVDRKYRWTIPFEWISSDGAITTWQQLFGFISNLNGMWDSFLYYDEDDFLVTAQEIAVGDGPTKVFQMGRTRERATDNVLGMELTTPAPIIYLNAVAQGHLSGYTLTSSGVLTFTTAPGAGVVITDRKSV